jgi:hypothetical protein
LAQTTEYYFVEGFTVSVVDRCPVFPEDDLPGALEPDLDLDLEVETVVRVVALDPESAGVDITSPVRVTTTT